jgi:hypothetical protein
MRGGKANNTLGTRHIHVSLFRSQSFSPTFGLCYFYSLPPPTVVVLSRTSFKQGKTFSDRPFFFPGRCPCCPRRRQATVGGWPGDGYPAIWAELLVCHGYPLLASEVVGIQFDRTEHRPFHGSITDE